LSIQTAHRRFFHSSYQLGSYAAALQNNEIFQETGKEAQRDLKIKARKAIVEIISITLD